MSREKRMNDFYMGVALSCSEMSRAERLKVGAIVVKNDNIISFSWNGTPAGWSNVCEEEVITEYESHTESELITKPEVLHAEENALMKLAKSIESGYGAKMYVTHAPCMQCAKLIYSAGITKVYYREQYRSIKGLEFLQKCNVEVEQL